MKISRVIMWSTLLAIGLLAVLSAAASFSGAHDAKAFFNSIPLIIYWHAMLLLLAAGLAVFPRLLRKPGLLLMHSGCILVIAGSMWSSQVGHRIAAEVFGIKKVPTGYMSIPEGVSESHIVADNREMLGELPFSIRLNKFSIEYYPGHKNADPNVFIRTKEGEVFKVPASPGSSISLGNTKTRLTVARIFNNFKMQIENGATKAYDAEGGSNPAVELKVENPDGTSYSAYAFQHFAHPQKDGLQLAYVPAEDASPVIKSYLSDLSVLESGREVLRQTIAVNHPLHFGGYHFYQHSYGQENGNYTVLSVTSDSGLYLVFSGYFLLCLGALWHFWLDALIRHFRERNPK